MSSRKETKETRSANSQPYSKVKPSEKGEGASSGRLPSFRDTFGKDKSRATDTNVAGEQAGSLFKKLVDSSDRFFNTVAKHRKAERESTIMREDFTDWSKVRKPDPEHRALVSAAFAQGSSSPRWADEVEESLASRKEEGKIKSASRLSKPSKRVILERKESPPPVNRRRERKRDIHEVSQEEEGEEEGSVFSRLGSISEALDHQPSLRGGEEDAFVWGSSKLMERLSKLVKDSPPLKEFGDSFVGAVREVATQLSHLGNKCNNRAAAAKLARQQTTAHVALLEEEVKQTNAKLKDLLSSYGGTRTNFTEKVNWVCQNWSSDIMAMRRKLTDLDQTVALLKTPAVKPSHSFETLEKKIMTSREESKELIAAGHRDLTEALSLTLNEQEALAVNFQEGMEQQFQMFQSCIWSKLEEFQEILEAYNNATIALSPSKTSLKARAKELVSSSEEEEVQRVPSSPGSQGSLRKLVPVQDPSSTKVRLFVCCLWNETIN
jgi:hypothetical protein